MRKTILGLMLLGLLATPALGLAGAADPGGLIIDNQGQRIVVERFAKLLDNYPFVYEDSETDIPLHDIRSLTYNQDETITLVTTTDKSFKVTGEMGICYTDLIHYWTKNPLDGSLQAQTIDPLLVKEIIFNWAE